MEKEIQRKHNLNSLIHSWYIDMSDNPQEIDMEPIIDISLIILLERGYQNFKSQKNQSNKKIKLKSQMEVDYESMVIYTKNDQKNLNIQRGKNNKIVINLNSFTRYFFEEGFQFTTICNLKNFVHYYRFWYQKNLKIPSLDDVVTGIFKYEISMNENPKDQCIREYINNRHSILSKAINAKNKQSEIGIEQLSDPQNQIIQIVAFIVAMDSQYLNSQHYMLEELIDKKQKKQFNEKADYLGPFQFWIRFGLYAAQRNKQNKFPEKFSLWLIFDLHEDGFDLPEVLIKEIKKENRILFLPTCRIFFNKDIQNFDDNELQFYKENEKTNKIIKLQINVLNRDDFDFFAFDSEIYSPYSNDQRVLVSEKNRYLVENVHLVTLESGLNYNLVVLNQCPRSQNFTNSQQELENELFFYNQQTKKCKKCKCKGCV